MIDILVLTGAGVSVPSGIQPFRGPGGLWTLNPDLEAKSHVNNYKDNWDKLWDDWAKAKADFAKALPNPAHKALVDLEKAGRVSVVTQNVDGLHEKANSSYVLPIHGSLSYSRCSECGFRFPDSGKLRSICPDCRAPTRPDIVLFGEDILFGDEMLSAAGGADFFLAVGTSGEVWPACDLVGAVRPEVPKVLINLEPWRVPHPDFTETILGPAEEVLPAYLKEKFFGS